MSAFFVSTSSQLLANAAAPVTAVPFSVGFWFNMSANGAIEVDWALSDTAGASNGFNLFKFNDDKMTIGAFNGGSDFVATATAITGGVWNYCVGRFISATNRRISIMHGSGLIEHGQGTASITPAGIDTVSLGATRASTDADFMNGRLAEYWMTNSDIQVDNAQLQTSLMRQLAYGGPFSVPHIAANIVDYQSLRVAGASDRNQGTEVYPGGKGRQVWTNVNAVTTAAHPPLPYWYVKPGQTMRATVV